MCDKHLADDLPQKKEVAHQETGLAEIAKKTAVKATFICARTARFRRINALESIILSAIKEAVDRVQGSGQKEQK